MAKSFFKKGFSDKPNIPKRKFQPRIWLPAPREGEAPDPKKDRNEFIVVHEGEPTAFYEHQCKLNGKWTNWFTCLLANGIEEECPLCDHGEYRAYYAAAYTVIDKTPYPRKDGTTNRGTKKLLIAKSEMLGRFELWAADHLDDDGRPDLWGVEFRVYRTSGEAPNIGDDWKEVKVWTEDELEEYFADELEEDENFLEPLDYEEWFKPCSVDELRSIAKLLGPSKAEKSEAERGPIGKRTKRRAVGGSPKKKGIKFDS